MNETVGYNWDEAGLRLLSAIHTLIMNNGGRLAYAGEIDKEWDNSYQYEKREYHRLRREWTKDEVLILTENSHLKAKSVAMLLKNRSAHSVTQKRHNMIQKRLIQRKKARSNLIGKD